MFNIIVESLLSLFFPVECLGCNKEDTYFCSDCYKKIPLLKTSDEFEHPLIFLDGIMTAVDYKNPLIKTVIHNYKFRYIKELAVPLAQFLIDLLENNITDFHNAIIIPVPLNKKRFLERCFNQSELIAKIFSKHFKLTILTKVIERARNTPHQVGLNKNQRQSNLKKAFKIINPQIITNKKIILIDDVVTTGSTLEEIAQVLKHSGAKEVWGLTVARD